MINIPDIYKVLRTVPEHGKCFINSSYINNDLETHFSHQSMEKNTTNLGESNERIHI